MMKTSTTGAHGLMRGLVVLAVAVLFVAAAPLVAAGVDGYRGDIGSYAEEGHGLIPEFLPFTESYRGDTGSYNEEGHGLVSEFLPFTESYRGDTGSYNEEGHGLVR